MDYKDIIKKNFLFVLYLHSTGKSVLEIVDSYEIWSVGCVADIFKDLMELDKKDIINIIANLWLCTDEEDNKHLLNTFIKLWNIDRKELYWL